MDSDMEDSVFDNEPENDSDAFSPEPKPKAKAATKKAPAKSAAKPAAKPAAKATAKAAPKKMVQTTLKPTKAVPNKRPKPETDNDDDDDMGDSNFSQTPPSAKKQKKAPATKKTGNNALAEVENDNDNENVGLDDAPETKPRAKTATETYQKLTQLEHILKRPDTYIGSVERTEQPMWVFNRETTQMELRPKVGFVPGLYKIFDEIVVNAADNKQRSPTMTYMKIHIDRAEGLISVENNGTGIPVEIHEKEKVYVPELVFGHLLAGSNFDDTEKKTVGGRNGFGAKLCNVFSTEFTLECQDSKNGKRYKQTWRDNMTKMEKAKITSNKSADFVRVTFKPDWAKFGLEGIDDDLESLLYRRVYDMAGTVRGIKVYLNGEQIKLNFAAYCGLYAKAIARERSQEEGVEPDATVVLEDPKGHPRWEVAFAVSDGSFQQVSFVNSIATTSGGPHVNYIADQICDSLLKTLTKKKKGHTLKANHIRNHIFIFVNCYIDNPAFNSQTKELMTTRLSAFGSKCPLSDAFLKKISQTDAIKNIIDFADAKADKLLAKSDGNKRSRISNAKLVDANLAGSKHGPECTLILTEGDSAKSLAVAGRAILDPDRFGVFPLRGKMLNVRDASIEQISKNQEIQNIKQFLGLKHKQNYTDTKGLRYGHLMIMADQDHDGTHIKGLLINFLQIQYPSLLKIPGFFQEFITPIVRVWQGSNPKKPLRSKAFYTQPEYEEWRAAHKAELHKWELKYYKGLGTSSNEDAQIYFNDLERHQKYFDVMKNEEPDLFELAFSKKKADARKEWLGNFVPGTYLDHGALEKISYDDFVNKELILFSMADNIRSIPSVIDGLKPGQRKVIFACLKRNLVKDKKVIELAGYVSEQTAYHHGDISLQQTIIGLAQTFVGSNNVNFLEPSGNFGSRLAGGSDAASARYIFTRLSPFARKIFSPLDGPLLDHNYEDNSMIEPKNYMPVIPTLLVNGADGIGTGWSTSIPNYHPEDIVRNLKRRMGRLDTDEEKPFETMIPWFRGWKGTAQAAEANRYQFNGIAYRDEKKPNEVVVTELPIRMWTDDFKAKLEDIIRAEKSPSFIKDYKEFNDHNNVHFEIQMDEKHMNDAMDTGLLEKFKLTKQVATSNMVAFDTLGRIHKYEKVEDILEEFYVYRLEMYTKRKAHWLGVYHADYRKLKNQARFIQEIMDEELVVSRKKKAAIIDELRERNYEPFSKNAEAKVKSEEEVENEAEMSKENSAGDDAHGYDYLLSMPIWSFTQERLDRLHDQIAKKKAEHDDLQALSEKDLWCRDLDDFLETWENQLKLDSEIASGLRRMSRYRNKKTAGRGRKGKDDGDFVPGAARAKPAAKSTAKSTKPAEKPIGRAMMAVAKKAKPAVKSSLLGKEKLKIEDEEDDDDAFSDDDFAALKKKVPAKEEDEESDVSPPVKSKRAAATKAKSWVVDDDSDSGDDDKMLLDVGDLVKGVGKNQGETSDAKTSRLGLLPMSRPESGHGESAAPKSKSKPSKASDFRFDDFDSNDDTNYEMLAKPSPYKNKKARDDNVDSYLSDDEPPPAAKVVSRPKTLSSTAGSSKPKPAAHAASAKTAGVKSTAAKATSSKEKAPAKKAAAPKDTQLSPAAKAYAAKKSKPRAKKDDDSDIDDDEDDLEMDDDSDSPPPRPAARNRPGRAAAAKSKPVYVVDDDDDEDEDEDDDVVEDEEQSDGDDYDMDDSD